MLLGAETTNVQAKVRRSGVQGRRERALQVRVVVPDDVICKGRDERDLVAAPDGRQLEGAEADERR